MDYSVSCFVLRRLIVSSFPLKIVIGHIFCNRNALCFLVIRKW